MIVKPRSVSDLFVAIAGVLIFLGLAYWIDMKGYVSYAGPLLIIGVLVFFSAQRIADEIRVGWVTKDILSTFAYILIFIGGKVYLDQFIEKAWLLYLLLGIILLNQSEELSLAVFGKK